MKRHFYLKRIALVSLCWIAIGGLGSLCRAEVQGDFDGDGISDVVIVGAGSAGQLNWKSTASATNTLQVNQDFGVNGDVRIMADWDGSGKPNLGVVRKATDSRDLVWKILLGNNRIQEEVLGRSGDVVVAGADFDGNGIADAAVVRARKKSKRLLWLIRLNMFAETDAPIQTVQFGAVGDRAFYLSRNGTSDSLAVLGGKGKNFDKKRKSKNQRLLIRDIDSKEVQTVKGFSRIFTKSVRPRPVPVQGADGVDRFFTYRDDGSDTTIRVFDLDGTELVNATFPGVAPIVVGNYNGSLPGEEIGFHTSAKFTVFNPFTEQLEERPALAAIPVDQVNVESTRVAETGTQ